MTVKWCLKSVSTHGQKKNSREDRRRRDFKAIWKWMQVTENRQTACKPVKLQAASITPAPRQASQQARVLRLRLCMASVNSWTSETAKVYSEETAENGKMSENVPINNRPISILPISLPLLLKELNSWREKYAHILTFVVPQWNS